MNVSITDMSQSYIASLEYFDYQTIRNEMPVFSSGLFKFASKEPRQSDSLLQL